MNAEHTFLLAVALFLGVGSRAPDTALAQPRSQCSYAVDAINRRVKMHERSGGEESGLRRELTAVRGACSSEVFAAAKRAVDEALASTPESRKQSCDGSLAELKSIRGWGGEKRMSQLYEQARGNCGSFGELYANVEKEQRELWSAYQKDACWTAMGSFDDDLQSYNLRFARDGLPNIGKACSDRKKVASARQKVDGLIARLSKPRPADGLKIRDGLYGIVNATELVSFLDRQDTKGLTEMFSKQLPAETHDSTEVILDDLSVHRRRNLVDCVNTIVDYRSKSEECSGPWGDELDEQISCYMELVQGDLGRRAKALIKSECGFDYHGLDKVVEADFESLELYKENRRQKVARVESFETLVARENQQRQLDEAAANSVVDKMPIVARVYAAKALCSAFSNSEQVNKALRDMHRVDRKSGTSNASLKRQYVQAQLILDEQIAKAKKSYRVAGGSKPTTSKVGRKFWCGQPDSAAVMEPLIEREMARIAEARLPKPTRLCTDPLWQSLRTAIVAENHGYLAQFQTCKQKDSSGKLVPMPAPGAPLKENGRTLLYYRINEPNLAPVYLVFEQTQTGWVFFRREVCAGGSGGACSHAGDFSRSADRYERMLPSSED